MTNPNCDKDESWVKALDSLDDSLTLYAQKNNIKFIIRNLLEMGREEVKQSILDKLEGLKKRGKSYYNETTNPVSMLARGRVDGHNQALTDIEEIIKKL